MTMRLAAEIWMMPQWRKTPGEFTGIARPAEPADWPWRLLCKPVLSVAADKAHALPTSERAGRAERPDRTAPSARSEISAIGRAALGVGDPAPIVAPALWTFTGAARDARDFRKAIRVSRSGFTVMPR
jgi:hypothetical protein